MKCQICSDNKNKHLIDISWTTSFGKSNTVYTHHQPDCIKKFGDFGIGQIVMKQPTLAIAYDGCQVKNCKFNNRIGRLNEKT